jgi:hypothetical protein
MQAWVKLIFLSVILVAASITLYAGATLEGRALAQTGAVTLALDRGLF